MKTLVAERPAPAKISATEGILRALVRARRTAVKTARMHKVPVVYLRNSRIVREQP